MLYLFNNVYLTPDKMVTARPEDDTGFVSMRMRGSAFSTDNFFSLIYDVKFKKPLFSASSHQELLKEHFLGREHEMIELFCQHRDNRLVIMCDEATMLHFTMRTLKTLLPNASVETAFTVLKYLYLPYFYLYDSGLVSFIGPNDFNKIYTNLVAREKEIKAQWARTKGWKVSARQLERMQMTAGVEFQAATYLANPSWRYASDFKKKVVVFAKKTLLMMLVNDLRQKILDGFVDIEKLNPDFDPLDRDIVEKVTNDATFDFLVDPEFVPNNWDYVVREYNMAALYELFQTYAPLRAFNLNDFSLLAKEDDLTFEDVLEHEMSSKLGRRLLGTDINYKNTVNVYLLDMMFDLYKNNPAALRQFSLERLAKR